MNKETITVKKHNPPVVRLVLSIILIALLLRLYRINYFFYFSVIFLEIILVLYGTDYLVKVIRYALDKEKYVVVRKSSLNNVVASEKLAEIRKIKDKYTLIGSISMSLIYAFISTMATIHIKSPVSMSYAIIITAFIALITLTSIDRAGKNKIKAMMESIIARCDTILLFDIMEQRRLETMPGYGKTSVFLGQMMASYFEEDYETMYSKASRIGENRLNPDMKIMVMELEGNACIKSGNPDGFNIASEKMKSYETKNQKIRLILSMAAAARRRWDVQIGLREKKAPEVIRLAADAVSETGQNKMMNMEYTYILAELQEMQGMMDKAAANYKIVADNAGTMTVRSRAIDKLSYLTRGNSPDTPSDQMESIDNEFR